MSFVLFGRRDGADFRGLDSISDEVVPSSSNQEQITFAVNGQLANDLVRCLLE